MRCPKCQYVGFEPSPRCKNCGYELSLGDASDRSDDLSPDSQSENAPSLTLISDPEEAGPMADFDLQIFDDVPAKRVQAGAKAFDLDDLLANGPSSGTGTSRDVDPVIQPVSAVARRRQATSAPSSPSFSSSSSPSPSPSASPSASASAVATPPAMEVEALFKPAPIKRVPEPVSASEPARDRSVMKAPPPPPPAPPAPVTTELPLFMLGMSEISSVPAKPAPVVHAPVPSSLEAAADVMLNDVGALTTDADTGAEIDDRPLVKVPASPRAPLAVRRTTPDPARLRAKYGRGAAHSKAEPVETSGDLLSDSRAAGAGAADLELRSDAVATPALRLSAEPTPTSLPAGWLPGVGPAKRLAAAALDGALLASLDGAVVWFTLSVCGLAPAQAPLLPVAPLLLFFLLLDAGYLVLFTAACGQTIGKMAAGIRVVGTTTGAVINDRITIAQAVMRSLGSIASMVPLGAGFWFGLVGDRRAVHDRLAHTRVVAS
jgi:uncharacterized RDD family membrane protein YckC